MCKKLKFSNKIVLVSIVLAVSIPLNVFGKIEHGFSKGSYQLQKDGSYKLFRTYHKEDGNVARNEWVQASDDYNAVGVSYYEYYGNDGNILSNTTTPDGFLVNYEGRWYKNCPDATITETEGYRIVHNNAIFWPFSYDGAVVRNDDLGITVKYDETDYQEGIRLNMRNYTCSSYYSAFVVCLPDGTKADINTFPADKSTDGAIRSWVEDENIAKHSTVVYCEKEIGGKLFKGYKIISNFTNNFDEGSTTDGASGLLAQSKKEDVNTLITYRLYRAIPGGASWGIEYMLKNTDDDNQMINWLNTHMTVIK